MPSVRPVLLAALLLAAPAAQAHPLSDEEGRAVKCFVALLGAEDAARKRGDAAGADAFEAASKNLPALERVGMDSVVDIQEAFAAAHLTARDIELIAEECQRHHRPR